MPSIAVLPPSPPLSLGSAASLDDTAADIFSPTRVSPIYTRFDMSSNTSSTGTGTHCTIPSSAAAAFSLIPRHSPLLTIRLNERTNTTKVKPLKLFISSRYRRTPAARQQSQKPCSNVDAAIHKHPNALPSFQITTSNDESETLADRSHDKTPVASPSSRSSDKTPIPSPATARPRIIKNKLVIPDFATSTSGLDLLTVKV